MAIASTMGYLYGWDERVPILCREGWRGRLSCVGSLPNWGRSGIRVNAVAPGTSAPRRPSRKSIRRARPGLQRASEYIPLGRVGEPSDIADVMVFLASGGRALHHWSDYRGRRRKSRSGDTERAAASARSFASSTRDGGLLNSRGDRLEGRAPLALHGHRDLAACRRADGEIRVRSGSEDAGQTVGTKCSKRCGILDRRIHAVCAAGTIVAGRPL